MNRFAVTTLRTWPDIILRDSPCSHRTLIRCRSVRHRYTLQVDTCRRVLVPGALDPVIPSLHPNLLSFGTTSLNPHAHTLRLAKKTHGSVTILIFPNTSPVHSSISPSRPANLFFATLPSDFWMYCRPFCRAFCAMLKKLAY
jgi:hypothetical protein